MNGEQRDDTGRWSQIEGVVVDIACLRRYPVHELVERARRHTTRCATMGHCVESGYGIVTDDGILHLLDSEATPHVLAAISGGDPDEEGVRLVVDRRQNEAEMVTGDVVRAAVGEGEGPLVGGSSHVQPPGSERTDEDAIVPQGGPEPT